MEIKQTLSRKWLAVIFLALIITGVTLTIKAGNAVAQSSGCVTVYEHIGYGGILKQFCNGTHDSTALGSLNINISSLQVNNASVTLYAHPACMSPLKTFSSNVSDLRNYSCSGTYCPNGTWNDTARCITVESTGGGGSKADLVLDRIEVKRNDTGAYLNPGDTVPDGTSLSIYAYIKNMGSVAAENFYLEYYDNGQYIDDDYEGSIVDPGGNDIESEYDIFTISGAGQHTLRIDLDTTGVIPENNESNNSATFVVNVGSSVPDWDAQPNSISFDVYITGNGQSEIIVPKYNNIGLQTWNTTQVYLSYRYEPGDSGRQWDSACRNGQGCFTVSAFNCPSPDWVQNYLPTYVDSTTSPNQTGQFSFKFCNQHGKSPATYTEHYDIASTTKGDFFYPNGWTGRVTVNIHVQSVPPSWEAKHSTQSDSPGPVQLPQGGNTSVTADFTNTGSSTWTPSTVSLKRRLGPSSFDCGNGTLQQSSVASGQVGRFTLPLCGNNTAPGSYPHPSDYGLWSTTLNNWIPDPTPTGAGGFANAWWDINVQSGYLAQPQSRDLTLYLPKSGSVITTVMIPNVGSTVWNPTGNPAVSLNHEYKPGDKAHPDNNNWSTFWCNNWPHIGSASVISYSRAAYVKTAAGPNQTGQFPLKLCNNEGLAAGQSYRMHVTPGYSDYAQPGSWIHTPAGDWATITITVVVQEDYQAQFASQSHTLSNPVAVPQHGPMTATVIFTNTGAATWQNGDIWLETESGLDSPFNCLTWNSPVRAVTFKENSVGPGQTATFEFPLCGNNKPIAAYTPGPEPTNPTSGYTEFFGLKRSNGTWVPALSGPGQHGEAAAWFPISIVADYLAEWNGNDLELTVYLPPTGTVQVGPEGLNVGHKAWQPNGNEAVSVNYEYLPGDSGIDDPTKPGGNKEWSAFWCDTWPHAGDNSSPISKSRAAYVNRTIPINDTAIFTWSFCSKDNAPGSVHREHYTIGVSPHSQPGNWLSTPAGQRARMTTTIVIQADYMGEFAYQEHTDVPLNTALVTPTGFVTSTVVIKNTGLKPWNRNEVMLRLKDVSQDSPFYCPDWPSTGYAAHFEGPGPIEPGDEAIFHVRLCGSGQALSEFDGQGGGYTEHFVLYRNNQPIIASQKGNSDGHVEYWVPISVVENIVARTSIVSPEFGQVFQTIVPLDVRLTKTGNTQISKVIVKYLGVSDSEPRGEWRTVKEWTVQPGQFQFTYDWDISNFPDQPDIQLGVEAVDAQGNVILNNWCQRVVIAKDTSGFKATLKSASGLKVIPPDGTPAYHLLLIPIGASQDITVEFDNPAGGAAWSNSGDNKVALYEDDEPVGVCPCKCGRIFQNAFEKFDFTPTPFSSVPGNPATGVAAPVESAVGPGQSGTFKTRITAPSQPGYYWLDLGLAHGPNWIYDGDINNNCDNHARVTFLVRVYNPVVSYSTTRGRYSNRARIGDPVDSYTGNHLLQMTWLEVPGRGGPFTWGATYNSILPTDGTMGWGWNHGYNWYLLFDGLSSVTVQNGDARLDTFTDADNDGQFEPPPAVHRTLTRNVDGTYTLRYLNQTTRHFDQEGRMTRWEDRHGNAIQLGYNSAGYLTSITDRAGRTYTLRYDVTGQRIVAFEPPFGQPWRYEYDANDNLVTVTDPTGNNTRYTYDGNHRLLTITDQNGNLYLENRFDAQGRVEWQRSVDNETNFAYNYSSDGSGYTVMTDGRGNNWTYRYDQRGWLVEEKDPLNQSIFYEYDTRGNRTKVTDRQGNATAYEYDSRGNLTRIIDAEGGITTYSYNAVNDRTGATDAESRVTTYVYNNGLLERIEAPENTATHFTYNQFGQITAKTDANGYITRYTYDGYGNPVSVTDGRGFTTQLVYDIAGRKAQETNARGYTTRYTYDALGRLLTGTAPYGYRSAYTYDKNGNKTSQQDAEGRTTTYQYDAKDRLVQVTNPAGRQTGYQYDVEDNLIREENFAGETTGYVYDAAKRLVEKQNGLGHKTGYSYDANGNRTAVTDPNGRATTYVFDKLNRLVEIIDPLNRHTTYQYDNVGNKTKVTDNAGNATTYVYDGLDRLIKVIDAAGGLVEYQYDGGGNMTQMKDANGHITTYQYDEIGQLRFTTGPESNVTELRYDKVGNQNWQKDAKGQATTYEYDRLNRLLKITYPDQIIQYSYDKVGNLIQMDDNSGITGQIYDNLNRLIRVTTGQEIIRYGYDAMGRRQQLTYPGGQVAGYTYDQAGRMTHVADWRNGVTQYSYDQAGNLTGVSLPNGAVIAYTYDQANQVETISHTGPGGAKIATFSYTYDSVGNRQSVTQWLAGGQARQTVEIPLKAGWNLKAMPVETIPNLTAEQLCEQTAPANSLGEVTRWRNNQWNSHLCNLPFNDFETVIEAGYFLRANQAATATVTGTHISALTRTLTFQVGWNLVSPADDTIGDAETLCQAIAGQGGQAAEVVRWHNGQWNAHPCGVPVNNFSLNYGEGYFVRVSSIGNPLILPGTGDTGNIPLVNGATTYSYDALYRLTSTTYHDGKTIGYSYDSMGNRLTMVGSNGTTNYLYNQADQLLTAGSATFTWDANGNMTGRVENGQSTTYSYDARNMLVGANNTQFTYDGANRRISKTVGGQITHYINDIAVPNHQVLVERVPAGDTLYLYGLGRIARFTPDGQAGYYHADALGSVHAISDESGQVATSYGYDDFGSLRAANGQADTFSFTGEQSDGETGLIYLRARYYDPSFGRFVSKDTFGGRVGNPKSLNRYVYVENRPVNYVDPSGHEKKLRALFYISMLPMTGADGSWPEPVPNPTPTGYTYIPSGVDWEGMWNSIDVNAILFGITESCGMSPPPCFEPFTCAAATGCTIAQVLDIANSLLGNMPSPPPPSNRNYPPAYPLPEPPRYTPDDNWECYVCAPGSPNAPPPHQPTAEEAYWDYYDHVDD